jgi:hypothetical protein
MSDTAIADVGATLQKLLQDNMEDLITPTSIVLLSPGDVQDQNIRLSIFLYSIVENPHLKNDEPIFGINSLKFPPLQVDLYYLLTVYTSQALPQTEQTLLQHRILGRAMRILYDNSILRGSILQGSMAGTAQELRIVANPISLDDLNQIWSTFRDLGYRLSISYLITPVRIDSGREVGMQRVVSKEMNYLSAGRQE